MTTQAGRASTRHLELLDARDWGLIVYDEVHLLPAPIFRMTADLQARRRLGLTATLVREDGREGDVFSLIGPKRYDAPWKDIEAQGWIAPADCVEVRVTLPESRAAGLRDRRARGALPARVLHAGARRGVVEQLVGPARRRADAGDRAVPRPARRARRRPRRAGHQGRDPGQGARSGSSRRSAPARSTCWWSPRSRTSPSTCPRPRSRSRCPARSAPARRRPSGSAGCCAPRPTAARPRFYTIVSRDTVDADFAQNRQRFLAEQGYAYRIIDADLELAEPLHSVGSRRGRAVTAQVDPPPPVVEQRAERAISRDPARPRWSSSERSERSVETITPVVEQRAERAISRDHPKRQPSIGGRAASEASDQSRPRRRWLRRPASPAGAVVEEGRSPVSKPPTRPRHRWLRRAAGPSRNQGSSAGDPVGGRPIRAR